MEGFQVSKVIGDGNCLFRSVALLLNKQHQQLRQEVVQHVKSHWHYYQPFLLSQSAEGYESYITYKYIISYIKFNNAALGN